MRTRRFMGRGWGDFAAPPGFVYAESGDATFAQLPDVCDELGGRLGAVAYEHVLSTTRGQRQVLGARALDAARRCVAWVLVVELDGELPHLHLSPQRFQVEDDVSLGDQTFDLMYRVVAHEHGDPRSAVAQEWLAGFVAGVRDLLVTRRPLDLATCGRHLVHVRPGSTSPGEALDTFGGVAAFLVELADRLGPLVYARHGQPGDHAQDAPDIVVADHGESVGADDGQTWLLLPGAPAPSPSSPPPQPGWPLLPRGPIDGPDDPPRSV